MLRGNWTEMILVKNYHFFDHAMNWEANLTIQKTKVETQAPHF